MERSTPRYDRFFLIVLAIIVSLGFIIFLSASMGLIARNGAGFSSVVLKQVGVGIIGGVLAAYIFSRVRYSSIRSFAFFLFLFSLILTSLVFVPVIGFSHGGAHRWLSIFGFSFQPAEVLKFAYVLYLAAWLASVKKKVTTWQFGLLPFLVITAVAILPLVFQPDMGTSLVITITGFAMYLVSGARWRDIGIVVLIGFIGLAFIAWQKPYIRDRLETFIHPQENSLSESYQVQQALIAIGSGNMFGRGFGQSVQKFNYLPEPIGDSVFAVFAEEFGFIGSTVLVLLFLLLALRGLKIAVHAPDAYGRLLASGLVILILVQSFFNIAAMLGVAPLSGMPLLFVSQGGSALLLALAETGIILNISKYSRI